MSIQRVPLNASRLIETTAATRHSEIPQSITPTSHNKLTNLNFSPSLKSSSFITRRHYTTDQNNSSPQKGTSKADEATIRARNAIGPTTWRSLGLFILTGIGLLFYFKSEKEKMIKRKREESQKSFGKPKIGGPFELLDQDGNVTDESILKGHFSLIYFGFTNCPDICPEELDKMTHVINNLRKNAEIGNFITPIFISVDPQRDSVESVREYLKDFHQDFIGLTGTYDQVAKVAKSYRVYFSRPPQVKEGEDYLVDHSIFFYLMDPNGEFVAVYGKQATAEEIIEGIKGHIKEFLKSGGDLFHRKDTA
ncbi:7229_t:CDS:2, partial [Ambispora gerdemannii]